jgi:hypothetical protein
MKTLISCFLSLGFGRIRLRLLNLSLKSINEAVFVLVDPLTHLGSSFKAHRDVIIPGEGYDSFLNASISVLRIGLISHPGEIHLVCKLCENF